MVTIRSATAAAYPPSRAGFVAPGRSWRLLNDLAGRRLRSRPVGTVAPDGRVLVIACRCPVCHACIVANPRDIAQSTCALGYALPRGKRHHRCRSIGQDGGNVPPGQHVWRCLAGRRIVVTTRRSTPGSTHHQELRHVDVGSCSRLPDRSRSPAASHSGSARHRHQERDL